MTTGTGPLRERQDEALGQLFREIAASNAFYRRKWREAGIAPEELRGLDDLRRLPFTTKSELEEDQRHHPPGGSILGRPLASYTRCHQTSGTTGRPLRWYDTPESWEWWLRCWLEVYRAAGVGPGDRVFVAFSFGPFIGFWAAFEAAARLPALALPGGGLSTVQRLHALREHQATALVCTPTYALRLAETAAAEGIDPGDSLRVTIHAGEPGASVPAVRARLEQAFGAQVLDHAGATEVGAWGHGCSAGSGLHVNEEEFVAEVVDPVSAQPVAADREGFASGELVLTNLGRPASPVVRYRTGDAVRLTRVPCACGRHTAFLAGGVPGRVDDMLVIRGVNLYPSALENLIREVREVEEFAVEVQRRRSMAELRLRIETRSQDPEGVAGRLRRHLECNLPLRAEVEVVAAGSLPRPELKARRFHFLDGEPAPARRPGA